MNAHVDGRREGAALRPLSPDQVRSLVLLAREAYGLQPAPVDGFDAWRHRQCMTAVERPGLRECLNEDYLPLKAHFLALAGREREADAALFRAQSEDRRQALWCLDRACRASRDVLPRAMEYAEGFLRHKRGVSLDEATARDLRHAAYVVARKAESERRKGAAA